MNINENIAIIDIGSNSVRIRISSRGSVFFRHRITTQLAKNSKGNVLDKDSVKRTFEGLDRLFEFARLNDAQIFVFATAAVRNATNSQEFCSRFFNRYGVPLDVVSGEREAMLGISGALKEKDGILIDVGGASSEIAIKIDQKIVYSHSIQLGAVTLTDLCQRDINSAFNEIEKRLSTLVTPTVFEKRLYAIGGTANIVAFIKSGKPVFEREKTNGQVIKREELHELTKTFYSLLPQEIVSIYKIDVLRAEVIHSGALLLYCLAKFLKVNELILTEDDNLEGYYHFITKGNC